LTEPTSGMVNVCGINSTTNPIEVKRKVGYLPEDVGFYDNLTGLENILYTARLNGLSDKEAAFRADKLIKRVGLADASQKKSGKYSRGMRQRLGLADVLIKNPEVIILDEPTLGIDPKGVLEFLDLIIELSKEDGLTVLFSSHHLHQVQQVCDRVGLLVHGKMLAEGNIESLSKKLFSNSAFIINAGLTDKSLTTEWLKGILKYIDGIVIVHRKEDIFEIECTKDLSANIAKAIIEKGAGLNFLNNKEYGLDEIYYRYFEGGVDHE